eukprot:487002-Pyramimonas_sp.AAC.1
MTHVCVVGMTAGRIWNTRPECDAYGLISVIQNPKHKKNTSVFKKVAFSPKADTLATVDNRGNVFAFHIK